MAEYINKVINYTDELKKWSRLSFERAEQLTLDNILKTWEDTVLPK